MFVVGVLLFIAQATSTPHCDNSSSSSGGGAVANSVAMVVNSGPTNNSFNEPFVSVTVCVPGTSNCQTIDGILVDTGSVGLRILSSVLRVPLPQQTGAAAGAPIVECLPFVDGFTWGPVQTADVQIAGERASSIPIQVIGVDRFPTIPSGCSSQGSSEETQDDLAANGILGVGSFIQDCGTGCLLGGSSNPGLYYACPTPSTCQVTTQSLANQVANPVAMFSSDNNGVVIQLPAVPASGQPSVVGALIFGIGTQADNGLGSARVLTLDARGNVSTTFNGQSYGNSFFDSGSNAIFFLDSATIGLPDCKSSTGFYCPATRQPFSATIVGANSVSIPVSFFAGNIDTLNATISAYPDATGSNPGGFDWGLPLFFGRSFFTAIEGRSTPGGTGPYWAF
jgi:hypothetical protein